MTEVTILANADLVLADEVVRGAITLRDGWIAALDPGRTVPKGAVDCEGDMVAPGLVELHTDNLERHIFPRPKVEWPHHAAIVAHDAELAGCGITTVFDAIRVGSSLANTRGEMQRYARGMADEILAMRAASALKISHHLHLRAEICSETLIEELDEFGETDRVGIVSLMDHTPGQRQFTDLKKLAEYVRGKEGLSAAEFDAHVARLTALRDRVGDAHEAAAVAAAKRYGAVLASHDDSTAAQVATSRAHGVTMAEFPTTAEAAEACHDAGIAVIMGAPNLVRGGSHSGNVATHDLAEAGQLDILSSDYVPAALLMAAWHLGEIWGDVARGIGSVTAAPAQAARLDDRGVLAPDKRADLVRIHRDARLPIVRSVWSAGRRVA